MALTPSNPGQVSPPNDLTEQGTGSVAIPNNLTEQSAGSVAIPNNLTEQSAGSVAIPNNLTEQSAGSVAIPNNLTEQSAGSVAIPNNLTEQAVGTIPRTLDPILKLDFENEVYETTSNQGLDDIVTYSRNSSASFWNRRQDEQGRWETYLDTDYVGSVTNLVTQSDDILNADWEKTNLTATATQDGGTRLVSADATTGYFRQQVALTANSTYTVFIDAKAGETTNFNFLILSSAYSSGGNRTIEFKLDTGIIGTVGSGGGDDIIPSIHYLGDGIYRCVVTFTPTVTIDDVSTLQYIRWVANGNGVDGFTVYRIQLTESAKELPYVPTTTTSASDTFVESPRLEYDPITAEPLGYLAEGASTNLVIRSEQFDFGAWASGATTESANAEISPDGTKSADGIIPTAVDTQHNVTQTVTVTNNAEVTLSVYAKAGIHDYLYVYDSTGSNGTIFNVRNGSITLDTGNGTGVIEYVGNGWYRCKTSITAVGTTVNFRIRLDDDGNGGAFLGDGTSVSTYLFGAMCEELPFASSYIRTEGATVQRTFDLMYQTSGMRDHIGKDVTFRGVASTLGINDGVTQTIMSERTVTSILLYASVSFAPNQPSYYYGSSRRAFNTTTPINEYADYTVSVDQSNDVSFGYVDKVETQSTSGLQQLTTNNETLCIGCVAYSGASPLYGHVKLVEFYEQSVTAQEVTLIDSLSGITEAVIPALSAPNNLTEQAVGAVSAPNQLVNEPTTNLLLRSEEFNTSWNVSNATIGVDSGIAPDGQTTADKIISDVGGGIRPRVDQSPSGSSDTYIVSVYGKPSGWDFLTINRGGTNSVGGVFDVANGTIVNTGASLDNIGIQFAGNGWYRCWIVFTDTPTNLQIGTSATGVLPLTSSTGDGASGILIWGAQCEVSQALQVPTSYLKTESTSLTEGQVSIPNNLTEQAVSAFPRTFAPLLNLDFANEIYATNDEPSALDDIVTYTRNSSASFWNRRLNRNGKWETFLDTDYVGSVTNLLEYSEDHTQSSYTFAGAISVDSTPLIKNGLKFWKVSDTGSTDGQHRQIVTVPTIDTKYTISIDMLPIDNAVVEMGFLFSGGTDPDVFIACQFNALSGVMLGERTATGTGEVSAYYLGDGIYRLVATIDDNGDNTTCTAIFRPSFNNNGSTSIDNNATGSQYVTRFQLTESSKELPYVKTLSTSASETFVESPRLEYDPITAQPLGYLSEGSSTNLITASEVFSVSPWSLVRSTVTDNDSIAPDGTKSADKLVEDATASNTHRLGISVAGFTSGEQYTYSIYAKKSERTQLQLRFSTGAFPSNCSTVFDLDNLTTADGAGVDSSKVYSVGNGWYRCELQGTANATGATAVEVYLASGGVTSYDGDGSSGLYIFGAQVEELSFASSYIRTEGSTVARVADSMIANFGDSLSNVSINYDFDSLGLSNAQTNGLFEFGTGTSGFDLRINSNGDFDLFDGTTRLLQTPDTAVTFPYSAQVTLTANASETILYYNATSFTGSGMSQQDFNQFEIGLHDGNLDRTLSGHAKRITVYNELLTAQEVSLL